MRAVEPIPSLAEEEEVELAVVHVARRRLLLDDIRENRTAYLMLMPSVIAFLVLVLFPLVMVILGTFSESDAVGRITRFGTLQNFGTMVEDRYFFQIVRQTAIFVFVSVVATVLLSFPLALIFNQRFPGDTIARALLLLPWAAPLAISAMTWRWIFHDQLGALNYLLHVFNITQENIVWLGTADLAFPAVIFVEVWSSIPFMTITFLAGLQAVPPHIYDAAKMDGADRWHEFWDMTVPQMKRVITIVTLLSVIWAFRSFTVIWNMTEGKPFYRTDISVTYLYQIAFKSLRFGEGFAIAFVTFLVLALFSVLYMRVLRSEEMA